MDGVERGGLCPYKVKRLCKYDKTLGFFPGFFLNREGGSMPLWVIVPIEKML